MQRILLALALIACNKKSDAPKEEPATKTTESKPADPKTAKPAEVKPVSSECPPGAWKNTAKDHPTFCLSLPKGYVLAPDNPKSKSHHEWTYRFVGEGDNRPELEITVQGISKPGVASGMSAYGPSAEDKKVIDEAVPNGRRIVSRATDYDKEEYGLEIEDVVLSKGEKVDVSKECGSCPPWEWIVRCWTSTGKKATADDRGICKSLRMP